MADTENGPRPCSRGPRTTCVVEMVVMPFAGAGFSTGREPTCGGGRFMSPWGRRGWRPSAVMKSKIRDGGQHSVPGCPGDCRRLLDGPVSHVDHLYFGGVPKNSK